MQEMQQQSEKKTSLKYELLWPCAPRRGGTQFVGDWPARATLDAQNMRHVAQLRLERTLWCTGETPACPTSEGATVNPFPQGQSMHMLRKVCIMYHVRTYLNVTLYEFACIVALPVF